MPATTQTINLSSDPLPTISVTTGNKVEFNNDSGANVTITMETPSLFNPSPGGSFDIENNATKKVTAGPSKGVDNYTVSSGAALGGRTGTINVN